MRELIERIENLNEDGMDPRVRGAFRSAMINLPGTMGDKSPVKWSSTDKSALKRAIKGRKANELIAALNKVRTGAKPETVKQIDAIERVMMESVLSEASEIEFDELSKEGKKKTNALKKELKGAKVSQIFSGISGEIIGFTKVNPRLGVERLKKLSSLKVRWIEFLDNGKTLWVGI